MISKDMIKHIVLNKTAQCLKKMPSDVYALYYFIDTNEWDSHVPTLTLMYNTLGAIPRNKLTKDELCWNTALWDTEEFPIIGDNYRDTKESMETSALLSDWFNSFECQYDQIERDPIDDYFEYTTGYRVLSELIEELAPEIKRIANQKFDSDVMILFGEFSYLPSDVKRISAINGELANAFLEYSKDDEDHVDELNNMRNINDFLKNRTVDSCCDVKQWILDKTLKCLKQMPIDTYGIRFSVSDGSAESDLNVPNVYLLYCTLGEFLDGNLKSNQLFGSQDWQEIPIIGGIGDDVTDESYKEIGMLYDWFVTNGCDYKKREIDPMDLMGVHEKYVGERILLDIIEELAPKIKQAAKETFGREILMLLGGDIFRPSDIKRIERINGRESESFLRYHECLVEQERSELEQLLNHFKKIL